MSDKKTTTSRGPWTPQVEAPRPQQQHAAGAEVPTHVSQLQVPTKLTLDEVRQTYPSNRWFGVDVQLNKGTVTVAFRGPKLQEQRLFTSLGDRMDGLSASLHVLTTLCLTHTKQQIEDIADEVPAFLGVAGEEFKKFLSAGASATPKA